MTMRWKEHALSVIGEVHSRIPSDATLEERKKAVDAAYPFGEGAHHPYKVWLAVRRSYLAKFGYHATAKPVVHESPLELAIRISRAA